MNVEIVARVVEPKLPRDLRESISSDPKAKSLWDSLTPIARRDWISWVNSAKQPETRMRRIDQTNSKLLAGKRRPCCYALVPMGLYKALGEDAKAKATWNSLSPDERRDFVEWVESRDQNEKKTDRIRKACKMLANGRRHA